MKAQYSILILFTLMILLASGCSSPVSAQSINYNQSGAQIGTPTLTPTHTGKESNTSTNAGFDGMATVESMATGTAVAQIQTGMDVVALTVTLPDESRVDFSFNKIFSLESSTLFVFELPRHAISLFTVLDEVGWRRYPTQKVTIEGRTGLTLHTDLLPKDAAVYFDGIIINFASKDIPTVNWPMDVKWIIVQ